MKQLIISIAIFSAFCLLLLGTDGQKSKGKIKNLIVDLQSISNEIEEQTGLKLLRVARQVGLFVHEIRENIEDAILDTKSGEVLG